MSATRVREIFFRVSTLLQDTQPQFTRWSERELLAWLNDAQSAIARYVPMAASRVLSVRLEPGTRQSIAFLPVERVRKDGVRPGEAVEGLFINDVVRNMGADGDSPGAAISVAARGALDAASRMWHAGRGARVVEHFTFDPRTPQTFYVYPPVGKEPVWVEMSLIVQPEHIAAGSYGENSLDMTTVSLDSRWDDDLVNYILARAWMKDAEHAANAANVQLYSSLFMESINTQVAVLTGQNPNLRRLPFAPVMPGGAS